MASRAFPLAFEERKPRDEKAVLVPKGARPMLKEEYPKSQLIVDRIKARHRHTLSIPFRRSWNTAALTALGGTEIEQEPQIGNDFELGFALHSQRLRVGALRNKEYFQKETEGFPEGWYRPRRSMDYSSKGMGDLSHINRPKGYMTTSFVHLAARRSRRKYIDYRDFADRINGILNVIMAQNRQLTLMARRDMQDLKTEGTGFRPRIKNAAGISYKKPGEGISKLELDGNSTWSTLTDSIGRDFWYISGSGSVAWGKNLRPDLDVDLKAKLQISTLRDEIYKNNGKLEPRTLETRKSGWMEVSNIASPAEFLKLKLNVSALYDSKHKGYFTPGIELALTPRVIQASAGLRRRAILPDYDELYWPSKLVEVNDNLQPEDFWEAYSSLNVNVIARLTLLAEASYSRPGSRITWEQLPGYIWKPVNVDTSESLTGEASLTLDLIRNLSTFASFRYQHFDNQLFEPEITATAEVSYGNPTSGSIALGASLWGFQPLEDAEPSENLALVYGRINKSLRNVLNIFIEGRYTFNREDILYYRGMPQAGRIVSFGTNIVFGGLD
jgi:hypothetical protein